jgi:hypothetical protein
MTPQPHKLVERYPGGGGGTRLDNGEPRSAGPALDLLPEHGQPGRTMATLWTRGEDGAMTELHMDPDAVMALYLGFGRLLEARGLLRRTEVLIPSHA